MLNTEVAGTGIEWAFYVERDDVSEYTFGKSLSYYDGPPYTPQNLLDDLRLLIELYKRNTQSIPNRLYIRRELATKIAPMLAGMEIAGLQVEFLN